MLGCDGTIPQVTGTIQGTHLANSNNYSDVVTLSRALGTAPGTFKR